MEFGKVSDILGIDWTLPPDDPSNRRAEKVTNPRVFAGATAWGVKNWIGKIYPEHTPSEKFLFYYARVFNCIELNTSHYRIPGRETSQKWLESVPENFIFCPKIIKDISHSSVGLTDKNLLNAWIQFLENLKQHCGPSFIQFHEMFSYREKHLLFKFLESWPKEFKLSIELRHPSWFDDHKILPALGDYLRRRNIGLIITDVAGRRDVLHTTLTADWAMIRLIGNELAKSDELRLEQWSERLSEWQTKGIQDTYLFFHQPDDIWTIEFAELGSQIFQSRGFLDFPTIEKLKPRDLFNL